MDITLILLFIPTMLTISITPGMCMTLAMTLGMSIGVRRTQWMMMGELLGVSVVATSAIIGVSAVIMQMPQVFLVFKFVGGLYLIWLGLEMWRSRGKLAIKDTQTGYMDRVTAKALFGQGFMTALFNPKGWAFFIALLPPFIDKTQPFVPQLLLIIMIIVISEWLCMVLYAIGGRSLRQILSLNANVRFINRIAGTLMMMVGVWLALGS